MKMDKLRAEKPVGYALVWIIFYVFAGTIGLNLSEVFGISDSAAVLTIGIVMLCLFMAIRKNDMAKEVGLTKPSDEGAKKALYYIPLVILIALNAIGGFDSSLSAITMVVLTGEMLFAAIVEEIVFRGLLFTALSKDYNTKLAIIISGVTFGAGHIVNLLNGYSGIDQLLQIVAAIAIGIVLALIFNLTGSINICIAFHFIFNLSSSFSAPISNTANIQIVAIFVVICAAYAIYLYKVSDIQSE